MLAILFFIIINIVNGALTNVPLTENESSQSDKVYSFDKLNLVVGLPSLSKIVFFNVTDNQWTRRQEIVGSNTIAGDLFGKSLILKNGLLVVGAPGASVSAPPDPTTINCTSDIDCPSSYVCSYKDFESLALNMTTCVAPVLRGYTCVQDKDCMEDSAICAYVWENGEYLCKYPDEINGGIEFGFPCNNTDQCKIGLSCRYESYTSTYKQCFPLSLYGEQCRYDDECLEYNNICQAVSSTSKYCFPRNKLPVGAECDVGNNKTCSLEFYCGLGYSFAHQRTLMTCKALLMENQGCSNSDQCFGQYVCEYPNYYVSGKYCIEPRVSEQYCSTVDSCSGSLECWLTGTSSSTRMCVDAERLPLGAQCSVSNDKCDPYKGKCITGPDTRYNNNVVSSCKTSLLPGDVCTGDDCGPGYQCATPYNGASNMRCLTPKYELEECVDNTTCATGLICVPRTIYGLTNLRCAPDTVKFSDEKCVTDDDCAGSLKCVFSGPTKICREIIQKSWIVGTPSLPCTLSEECPSPLTCDFNDCGFKTVGKACSLDEQCLTDLFCDGGICTAKKNIGESCVNSTQCKPWYTCSGSVCSKQIETGYCLYDRHCDTGLFCVDSECVDPLIPPARPAPSCPYTVTITSLDTECVNGFSDILMLNENNETVDIARIIELNGKYSKELHYNNGLFDVDGGGLKHDLIPITREIDVTYKRYKYIGIADEIKTIDPWTEEELTELIPKYKEQTGYEYRVGCCNEYGAILYQQDSWYKAKQSEHGEPFALGVTEAALFDNNMSTHFLYESADGSTPASISFLTMESFKHMSLLKHYDLTTDGRDRHFDPRYSNETLLSSINDNYDDDNNIVENARYITDTGYRYPKPYCGVNIKVVGDCDSTNIDVNRTFDVDNNKYREIYVSVVDNEDDIGALVCAHNSTPPHGYPDCNDVTGFSTDIFIEKLVEWNETYYWMVEENRTSAKLMDVFMYGVNLGLTYDEMALALVPDIVDGVINVYNIDQSDKRMNFFAKYNEKNSERRRLSNGSEGHDVEDVLLKTLLAFDLEYVRAVLQKTKYHFPTADTSFFFPTGIQWMDTQPEEYVMLAKSVIYEIHKTNLTNSIDLLQIETAKETVQLTCGGELFTTVSDNMAKFLFVDLINDKQFGAQELNRFRSPCNPVILERYQHNRALMSAFRTAAIISSSFSQHTSKYLIARQNYPILLRQILDNPNSAGFVGEILDEIEINFFGKWKTWFSTNTLSTEDTATFLQKALRGEHFYEFAMIMYEIEPLLVESSLDSYKRYVGDSTQFIAKKLVTFYETLLFNHYDYNALVNTFFFSNIEMIMCNVENKCSIRKLLRDTLKVKNIFDTYDEGVHDAYRVAFVIDYMYHILFEWGFDANDMYMMYLMGEKTGTKPWRPWRGAPGNIYRDAHTNPSMITDKLTLNFHDRVDTDLQNNNLDCLDSTSAEEDFRLKNDLPQYEKTAEIVQWRKGYGEIIQVLLTQHYIKEIGNWFQKRQVTKTEQKRYFEKIFKPMCNTGLSLMYGRGEDRNRELERWLAIIFWEAITQFALFFLTGGLSIVALPWIFKVSSAARNIANVKRYGGIVARYTALSKGAPALKGLKAFKLASTADDLSLYRKTVNRLYNWKSKLSVDMQVRHLNSFGFKSFTTTTKDGVYKMIPLNGEIVSTPIPFFYRVIVQPLDIGKKAYLTKSFTTLFSIATWGMQSGIFAYTYHRIPTKSDTDDKQYLLFNDKDKKYDLRIMLAEMYAYIKYTAETLTEELVDNISFEVEQFDLDNNFLEHSGRVRIDRMKAIKYADLEEYVLDENANYLGKTYREGFIELLLNDGFFDNDYRFYCDDDTFDIFGGNTCSETIYDDENSQYN